MESISSTTNKWPSYRELVLAAGSVAGIAVDALNAGVVVERQDAALVKVAVLDDLVDVVFVGAQIRLGQQLGLGLELLVRHLVDVVPRAALAAGTALHGVVDGVVGVVAGPRLLAEHARRAVQLQLQLRRQAALQVDDPQRRLLADQDALDLPQPTTTESWSTRLSSFCNHVGNIFHLAFSPVPSMISIISAHLSVDHLHLQRLFQVFLVVDLALGARFRFHQVGRHVLVEHLGLDVHQLERKTKEIREIEFFFLFFFFSSLRSTGCAGTYGDVDGVPVDGFDDQTTLNGTARSFGAQAEHARGDKADVVVLVSRARLPDCQKQKPMISVAETINDDEEEGAHLCRWVAPNAD